MAFIIGDPYTAPLVHAFTIQIGLLLFCCTCGSPPREFVHGCSLASAGFWSVVIIILIRRPRSPTPGDLTFVRWALLPIGIVGTVGALSYWTWIGVWDATNPRNLPAPR